MTLSRQILDDRPVRGPAGEERRAIGELEIVELEARRDSAAHQRVAGATAAAAGAIPGASGNRDLRLAVAAPSEISPR